MREPKYINAEQFVAKYGNWYTEEGTEIGFIGPIKELVYQMPAADVVSVVRCGECKYQDKGENDCEAWNLCGYRPWLHIPTEDDAFCSKGERKDG